MSGILQHAKRLWQNEDGFIVSAELVLIATILVLALVVGLTAVRNSLTAELIDVANAFGSINHSHSHEHGSNDGHSHADLVFTSHGHE